MADDRPLSRRGVFTRQSPVMEDRPWSGRPATATRISGTASRLTSMVQQQPAARIATTANFAGKQVHERPVTQQGLSGLRTGTRGGAAPRRQVEDRRFFEAQLQLKIRELAAETGRLREEAQRRGAEQATFLVYDRRVKEAAAELTELQGRLADFNLVVDKLNTDTEKGEVEDECRELRARNNQETQALEQLFAQRQQRELQVRQLEAEIERERHAGEDLVASMNPQLRDRYSDLQKSNAELQAQTEALRRQLEDLDARKTTLEDRISVSEVKREAVRLHLKLGEVEDERERLLEEERTRASPAQEREKLLQRVKEDNAETAAVERQVAELRERHAKLQAELRQAEQDMEESQSERHQKYRELRKREETMEAFLASFEESCSQERARAESLQEEIVSLLRKLSQGLAAAGRLPTAEEFCVAKDSLAFKEGELDRARSTAESLARERTQLQLNLQKVEALEEKIKREMETLRRRIEEMTGEMESLSDLDTLRDKAMAQREKLSLEKEALLLKKAPLVEEVARAKAAHEELKRRLEENETYSQLSNLERKLALLMQNNFALKEFVDGKKSEMDYEPLKDKVFALVDEYNAVLKDGARKSATYRPQ